MNESTMIIPAGIKHLIFEEGFCEKPGDQCQTTSGATGDVKVLTRTKQNKLHWTKETE